MSAPRRFGRLYHDVPHWVEAGGLYYLRVRVAREQEALLTEPALARALLETAEFYRAKSRWWLGLLVLMPDHLHALVSFPAHEQMSKVVGQWKRWAARHHGVRWQEGYFDHRLRDDERGEQLASKADYILNNPVALGLCASPEDWPWKIHRR